MIATIKQSRSLQQVLGPAMASRRVHGGERAGELHVLIQRSVSKKMGSLKNEAEFLEPQIGFLAIAQVSNVAPT